MASNTGPAARHSQGGRQFGHKLTYIPETENNIVAHIQLYVVGDMAYRFCKRLVRDERSEVYHQKLTQATVRAPTTEHSDASFQAHDSVHADDLLFYCELGPAFDTSGLAKVRLTTIEAFEDELPEASEERGAHVGILFLCGNLRHTLGQSSVGTGTPDTKDNQQLGDLERRLIEHAHNKNGRPCAAIVAFDVNAKTQETLGTLAKETPITFFEEDDDDSLFEGVQDMCMKIVEYVAKSPPHVEDDEEPPPEKASTRCACTIA